MLGLVLGLGLGLGLALGFGVGFSVASFACCTSKLFEAAMAMAARPEPSLSLGRRSNAEGLWGGELLQRSSPPEPSSSSSTTCWSLCGECGDPLRAALCGE